MLAAQASRKAVDDRGMAGCAASLAIADRLTVTIDRSASAPPGEGGAGCAGSGGAGASASGGGSGGCTSGGTSASGDAASGGTGTQLPPQRAHRTARPAVMRESGTSYVAEQDGQTMRMAGRWWARAPCEAMAMRRRQWQE